MRRAAFVLLFFSFLATACGGAQSGRSSVECPTIGEGMSERQWDHWATCAGDPALQSAEFSCSAALQWATSATPPALAAATRCVLGGDQRQQITYVGDALDSIAFEEAKVVAIASALPGNVDRDRQEGILAASFTENAQLALGRVLERLEEDEVEFLFHFAVRRGLGTLLGAFAEYEGVEDLMSSVPEEDITTFANLIDRRQPLSEMDRWALARSGVWSAHEIVQCQVGNEDGCDELVGASPLILLDVSENRGTDVRTTGMVIAAAGEEDVDEEEVGAVVRWVSRGEGSNRGNQLRSMVNDMTTPTRRDAYRYGIARSATPELCSPELVLHAARRASADDDQAQDNVWNTFLTRCNYEHWTWRDRLIVLAIGSDLNAHNETRALIVGAFDEDTENTSCDQLADAAGTAAAEAEAYDRPMTGLAFSIAVAERNDCLPRFNAELTMVARDGMQHPEARLAAIAALADSGDRATCSQISDTRSWQPGEDQPGWTALANELEAAARVACGR